MKGNAKSVARKVKQVCFDVDVAMKGITKACSKGCSHCCHQHINVHYAEGASIDQFISQEMPVQIKLRVREQMASWFAFFDSVTPDGRLLTQTDLADAAEVIASNRIGCPFLIDSSCSIYNVRPVVCRTHCVPDSSDNCKDDPLRFGDEKGVKAQEKAFLILSKEVDFHAFRPLSYATQEALGLRHKCKPIAQLMVPSLTRPQP